MATISSNQSPQINLRELQRLDNLAPRLAAEFEVIHVSITQHRAGHHPLLGLYTMFLRQLCAVPLFRHPLVANSRFWSRALAYYLAVEEFNAGSRAAPRGLNTFVGLTASHLGPLLQLLGLFGTSPVAIRRRLTQPGNPGFVETPNSKRNGSAH